MLGYATRIRQDMLGYDKDKLEYAGIRWNTLGYARIRWDTLGYGRIR